MLLRGTIDSAMGYDDECVFSMVMRHLARCSAAEELQLDELSWLLGVVVGVETAGKLLDALVEFLEVGLEESWYDAQLRRKYMGQVKRGVSELVWSGV